MTDTPAGWYDDPENATQYRYWDGAAWSDHRSPKALRPALKTQGPGAPIARAFELFQQIWVQMLIIAGVVVLFFIAGLVVLYIGFELALSPSVVDILERVLDPNFDPDRNPLDRALVDSIEWDWSLAAIGLIVGGGVFIAAGQYLGFIVGLAHAASRSRGHERPLGAAVRYVAGRLARWLGITILWALVFGLFATLLGFGYVVAANDNPVILVGLIPVTIVIVVYGWPYFQMCATVLVLGPRDRKPFRHTIQLVKADWPAIAGRIFLVNLALIGIQVGFGALSAIPVAGVIVSIAANFLVTVFQILTAATLYEAMDGPLDPELEMVAAG